MKYATAIIVLLFLSMVASCNKADEASAVAQTGGDFHTGRDRITYYGCASCHVIPGIRGADAHVGPPLDHIASRTYIGVGMTNTPKNMMQWIQHPHDLAPKAAMPDLHINETDARDIACYLYTLK